MARVFYEELVGAALNQLRITAQTLAGESSSGSQQKRVESAIPHDALPHVRNFLLWLAQEERLNDLPAIVQAFESYSRVGAGNLDAEVISAVPLEIAQQERIATELSQQYDQPLEPVFHVDEALIGGLIIRVGDQVFDNSLRTRLGVVQRNMLLS